MKEYRIAKGWAIIIYLFAPLLIGLFGWLLILPFQNGNFEPNASWILIPVSLAMIALMVFGVLDAYKGRLIIQDNSIKSISTFSNRELAFDEIKGFTLNEQYIFVEPTAKGKKRIKISKYIGGYNEILHWLIQNFPDLDIQNAILEEQEILNDDTIGWTKEIREEKLTKARQTSKLINWAAGIVAAWSFFYPTPYQYSILAAIIIPILALIVVRSSNGLIRVDEKNGSAYPSVIYAFIFPSLGLMLRAVFDYNIFDYSNAWLTSTIIALALLFLLLIKQKEITFKKKLDYLTVSSLALFLFAYSFGTVIHTNCYYDNSEPEYFTAKVLNKRVSSGKSTSYYFELSPWGQLSEIDEVSVGKGLFNRIEIGDEVNIYFRTGKLDIPWFTVTDK
ncbi:MAG: hypothetical protein JJU28_22670 [Cyclobacteriaceae bacterium]|nr:hypothetical protein [Cyclobacteriaceae bacterium]